MSIGVPTATTRWRCAACGNLTRFDVVRLRRTKEYWHFDLAGDVTIEAAEPLREVVEAVTCRWCGSDEEIEVVLRPEAGGPSEESLP